jgi:hypothetical protein
LALSYFSSNRRSLDLSLPAGAFRHRPPAIAQDERDATIAALKPPKRQRPLIAIIGINNATETTDYLMPYGILSAPTSPMSSRSQPSPVP